MAPNYQLDRDLYAVAIEQKATLVEYNNRQSDIPMNHKYWSNKKHAAYLLDAIKIDHPSQLPVVGANLSKIDAGLEPDIEFLPHPEHPIVEPPKPSFPIVEPDFPEISNELPEVIRPDEDLNPPPFDLGIDEIVDKDDKNDKDDKKRFGKKKK